MNAIAAASFDQAEEVRPSPDFAWDAMRLSGLLAALADRSGDKAALRDQPGREEWSGRPRFDWTYGAVHAVVGRLSAYLRSLDLPPGSCVGVCLAGGSEAALALLAVEQAGHTPCLLPVAWGEDQLAAALEAAKVQAVLTQGAVGETRPAELFCRLAARYFGLRFVCSFGPLVPDGVIDLDRVILSSDDPGPSTAPERPESGVVTFSRRGGPLRACYRPCRAVVASAVTFLVAARIEPGERILSLLAPDDHRGLTTGLAAALLSGATLEHHGLFAGATLVESLSDATPTHLVAPGWMEPALAKARLPAGVRSVVLVHDAPVRFKARTALAVPVVDALAFDEVALVARARAPGGQFALSLDDTTSLGPAGTRHLLRLRRDEDGRIQAGGLAAEMREIGRGEAPPYAEWRDTGFTADIFAGIVIGVS